jgi:hypothetical protein
LDHHLAEAEEELLVGVNTHAAKVFEQSVDLLLLVFFVVHIGHHNPLDKEFSQLVVVLLVSLTCFVVIVEVQGLQDVLAERSNLLMM